MNRLFLTWALAVAIVLGVPRPSGDNEGAAMLSRPAVGKPSILDAGIDNSDEKRLSFSPRGSRVKVCDVCAIPSSLTHEFSKNGRNVRCDLKLYTLNRALLI